MKKITLLFLTISSAIFAQTPTGAAPTPPTRDAVDVISLFTQTTDANTTVYSDITVSNFNPNWGSTSGNVTIDAYGGDLALTYPAFDYQGTIINSTGINLSAMTTMHIDIWTNSVSPNVFLISASSGEKKVNISANPGTWSSVEIPLTDFTSQGLSLNDIKELKFDGGDSSTAIYIDNIYFSKPPADPATDATLSDLMIDGTSIEGFSAATTEYTQELVIGTTTPGTISATTTNSGATSVITQATSVPGDATVVVTASNGTDTETYKVSFVATIPNAAPIYTAPANESLALLADITDANGFTNFWNPTYYFGSNVGTPDLDASSSVNKAVKMDFSIAGWGGGVKDASDLDVITDVTSYDYVNFSYFAVDEAPGVNGHNVKFILIGGSGTGSGEFSYVLNADGTGADGTLVLGSWQNVSIPLSEFETKGFSKDNFFQFKLGSTSDLNTKRVYFDNLFFSQNAATLNTSKVNIADISTYPNPTKDVLNINSKEVIQKVEIFNAIGRRVKSIAINKKSDNIDVSSLSTGVYILKYSVNNTVGSMKFIKE